ncbi:MAG: DUF1499 domain-containing protein [Thermoanaerobaculia bacterium]
MRTVAMSLTVVGILLMAGSGPGTRWAWWNFRVGLLLFAGSGVVGLIAAVTGGVAWWRAPVPSQGNWMSALPVVIGLSLFLLPLWKLLAVRQTPPIHDVTTDLADPPRFSSVVPLRGGDPKGIDQRTVSMHQNAYRDLAPVVLPFPPDRAFARAIETARAMDWHIVSQRPEDGMIEATDTTRWFGFRDDVAIRIRPLLGDQTRIDVRSTSRVGVGDAGQNARRIRAFLQRLRRIEH